MTPEGKVKDIVKKVLDCYGADIYTFMPVQMGYGAPGLDFFCCAFGHFLAIETKAPGKKPDPRQTLTIEKLFDAKAKILVIDGDASGLTELVSWLMAIDPDQSLSRAATAVGVIEKWLARDRPTANEATSSRKKTPAPSGSTSEPNTKPSRGCAGSAETKGRVKKRAQPGVM